MKHVPAILIAAAAAFATGLALVGCEEDAGDDAESGSFISRDILADGSIVTVYEQTVVTTNNTVATQTTTITQPAGGGATTNITITPTAGTVDPDATNTIPIGAMSSLSALPTNAIPLPAGL